MRHGSLFSGIGGFDLASEWMGWENVFHCEWNPFGQRVLQHYWPNAELFDDITKTNFTKYYGTIDLISGGFPCQPYSASGKRLGKEDERHLWPEMLRAIREIAPRYVVGENVRGITNWNGGMVFDEVCADLENLGYQVAPFIIPACSVNAVHQRERVWFIAYSDRDRWCQDRRHDRFGKNVNGCNNEEFGATNTKDAIGCGTNGGAQDEPCSCARIGVKTICEKDKTTDSRGICRMDKNIGNKKGISDDIEPQIDNSGALVSNVARNVADTERIRLQEWNETANVSSEKKETPRKGGQSSIRPEANCSRYFARTNWQDFPTQSPICGRNDGIPAELDGITISKWRTESIKAYGNAIVPQVVYQIFKSIQEYENLSKQRPVI